MLIDLVKSLDSATIIKWSALAYVIVVIVMSIRFTNRIRKYPYVIDKLVSLETNWDHLGRGKSWVKVSYEYQVGNKSYIGNRLSSMIVAGQVRPILVRQMAKIQYVSKDEVKVFYDSKKPSKSYLVIEGFLDLFR